MPGLATLSIALILAGQAPRGDEPAAGRAAVLRKMEWKVGEATREALVAVPKVTAGAPLVFVWHGHGGTSAHAARTFKIHEKWPEAIVAYPQGVPTPAMLIDREGKYSGWQFNPGQFGDRDIQLFDAMLATFKGEWKADPKRVYATGHSNGGRFVFALWAARADEIAAFAPSASPGTGLFAKMKPRPCLQIAGEADELVPFASQKATMERLKALNGCEAEGVRWGNFQGSATLFASKGGAPLVTAIYPGGHQFPAEAPELIVKFFRERDRR